MDTETYKGYKIEIEQDENAQSPRDWDNITTMICFHGRYNLGDKHDFSDKDYNGWDEMEQAIIKELKPVIIKPLFMYDHSGITISTTPFNDRWDSGQIGFVVIRKVEHFADIKRVTKKIKDEAERLLEGEVETYDNYLTGSVYGFSIKNNDGDELDSCYGYYGYNHEESGLMDEARGVIDALPELV